MFHILEFTESEEDDTSPFAARTELPRSPRRHDRAGSSPFSDALQAAEEELGSEPSGWDEVYVRERAPFNTNAASLQRSDSGGSSPGTAQGIRSPRSVLGGDRLLSNVAVAATEAEVEESVFRRKL